MSARSAEQTAHRDVNKVGGHDDHHDMSSAAHRLEMLHTHHRRTLWVYWTLLTLGVWVVAAPFTFGYLNESQWVDPSGGRGAWFSDQAHTALRAWLMTWSDLGAGLLLIVFAWRSLTPNRPKSLWACCFVGVWLTFAPVFFWAPTAAAYLNDTIVGALVIALAILVPGMPNMMMYMQMGGDQPRGWTYNPSSWPQRWIMIVTGFAGWIVSRYLAAYQLGYITEIWEPFFGDGSRRVLNSRMSHSWPISDAGLGALSYTFEFLMGWMGSPARWRTMPWMVAFFGFLVIPLGLTHIILVISQPVVVGAWCTFCLVAAAIMLPMIPLEFDEVIAMGQHMVEARRRGDRGGSLWKIFWFGGAAEGSTDDQRSPELIELPRHPGRLIRASIWGMSAPWTLVVSTLVGLWLMFAPSAFGIEPPASHAPHLAGALAVTVSVIAMGEVVRALRWANAPLGLALIVAPWMLEGGGGGSGGAAEMMNDLNCAICGALLITLAFPRGATRERYGLWDRWVR